MELTLGRIVHISLTKWDAEQINKRRKDARDNMPQIQAESKGYVAHVGNDVVEGDVFPAVAVRIFSSTSGNFQVLLDGSDTFWATSRVQGDVPGNWHWLSKV